MANRTLTPREDAALYDMGESVETVLASLIARIEQGRPVIDTLRIAFIRGYVYGSTAQLNEASASHSAIRTAADVLMHPHYAEAKSNG